MEEAVLNNIDQTIPLQEEASVTHERIAVWWGQYCDQLIETKLSFLNRDLAQ